MVNTLLANKIRFEDHTRAQRLCIQIVLLNINQVIHGKATVISGFSQQFSIESVELLVFILVVVEKRSPVLSAIAINISIFSSRKLPFFWRNIRMVKVIQLFYDGNCSPL